MRRERVVVVGAGPGGVAAAVQCRRLGVEPLLLDRRGMAGGLVENAFSVENYPGLERPLPGVGLAARLRAHLERFGLGVEAGEVTGLVREGEGFRLVGIDGGLWARCVILAVGTEPRRLGIPGEEALAGRRLFYEVRELDGRGTVSVVVVGAGEAAFDYALSLAEGGAEVTVCMRGAGPAARGVLAERVAARAEVVLRSGLVPVAVEEKGGLVVLRACRSGHRGREETLAADAVLVAVGRASRAPALLPEGSWGGGAVETALPGLYVVGDARLGGLGQAGIAVGDGLWAAAVAVRFLEGRG